MPIKPISMREMMQDFEGGGYESGPSLLLVRDDGPLKKDGQPTHLHKYTVVGSFVSAPIFKAKAGKGKDELPDPNSLTQLWQGEFSFRKEVVHKHPDKSVTGFHSLNQLVECGGLNPGMYAKHEKIKD